MEVQTWKLVDKIVFCLILLALLACLTAVLMLPSNPMERLPGQDNGVFLYAGQQVLSGKTPYLDFWDHKGPLIYFINALGLFIGSGSRWGVWALEFVFLSLTAYGLLRISLEIRGIFSVFLVLLIWIYCIVRVGSYSHFQDSNYTETYSLLFSVWAIYFWVLALRSPQSWIYYLLLGIMAGLTFALRPNNIGIQISIGLTELILGIQTKDFLGSLKRISLIGIGAFGVIGSFSVWFLSRGALPALVDAVFRYNLAYSQKNLTHQTALSVIQFGINKFDWIPVLGYVIVLGRFVSRSFSNKTFTGSIEKPFLIFLLIGFPLEAFLTAISGRILLHYYIMWLPYVCLLGASIFFLLDRSEIFRCANDVRFAIILGLSAFLILVLTNLPVISKYREIVDRFLFERDKIEATGSIPRYVNSVTGEEDEVLVWGNEVWINFLSRRKSPTKYAYQYPLFLPGYTSKQMVLGFLNDLKNNPPSLIVEPQTDTSEMLPLNPKLRAAAHPQVSIPDGMEEVFNYIYENYCAEQAFQDVIIYHLKERNVRYSTCQ